MYSQNVDSINILSTALANVLDTLMTIRGHRQVFENFVREANATPFLASQVNTFWMSNGARQFLMDLCQVQASENVEVSYFWPYCKLMLDNLQ